MSETTGATIEAAGGCLCGAVRYELRGPLRDVVNCHCGQCRRVHGHHGAYSAVARDDLVVTADGGLKWYTSSAKARRAFCRECGSTLFWEPRDGDYIAIAAGSIDPPVKLKTAAHIYTAELAGYYEITDGLEQWPGSMRGDGTAAPATSGTR